jgi:RNA polymerase sigma factor (sigma-70 family)
MATPFTRLLPELRRLAAPAESDAELLGRFVRHRDEAAFTRLVERHGAMVQNLCRRVLGDAHAAEDAYQATFLVLARKAAAIRRPGTLACWLYGVAHRVALKARCTRRRQPTAARSVAEPRDPAPDPLDVLTARELLAQLEEELQRLPAIYRMAVVCCCLDGLTLDEAAARLGCTNGTLRGRLERGRARLHERLVKRGLTLSAALATAEIARGSTSAAPIATMVKAALAFGCGQPTALVPVEAARLAQEVLRGASLTQLKAALLLTAAMGLAMAGAGALSHPGPTKAPKETATPQPVREEPRTDRQGDGLPPGAVMRLGTTRLRSSGGFLWGNYASLAYTPDGRFVVSGGNGGAVVWDAATGKEVRRLGEELPQPLGPVSLSADGKLVAVGGWGPDRDTAGAVYEVATGRRLYAFGNSGSQFSYGRFSLDGAVLAVYGTNNNIQLHAAATGKRLGMLEGHHNPGNGPGDVVSAVVFSPDNKTLISAGGDGTIRLWDVLTAKETKRLFSGKDPIRELAISPDGTLIAAQVWTGVTQGDNKLLDGDRQVRVWETASGKEVRGVVVPISGNKNPHAVVAQLLGFTPDGSLLTSGADDVMRLWDPRTAKELRSWSKMEGRVWAIAFAPVGKSFAAVEGHQTLSIREYPGGRDLLPLVGHRYAIHVVATTADGKTVATAGDDQTVFLWDAATGEQLRRLVGFNGRIRFMAFAPDGRTLFAAGYDDLLMAWDATTGREVYRRAGHEKGAAWAAALSPGGKVLAWAGEEKAVVLLDAVTGKDIRKLESVGRDVAGLTFAPDNRTLLGWTSDERLHVWNVSTGEHQVKPCKGLPSAVHAAAFSADAQRAAFGGQNEFLVLVDLATGKELGRIANASGEYKDAVHAIAFSPDGRTLAWAGAADGAVRLSEVATGKERRRFAGHRGGVLSLAFTAAGTMLVSGGYDTTGLVWDLTGPLGWDNRPPGPLDGAALAACWEDLQSADAARAYLAIRRLLADPARSAPYLGMRLRPAVPADAQRVARLLADLGSEQFIARDEAAKELETIGEAALPALRKVLLGTPPLEVRRRAEKLVEALESLSAERLRAVRAVETLEYVATPQARRILHELAKGAAGPRQTHEAQAALDRLGRR